MADAAPLSFEHLAPAYREEASERLAELEEALLELESQPASLELVGKAFRAMHTIKGSGAMFGFHDVERFTHELETVFDRVRNGALGVTPHLIGLALRCKDLIRAMIAGSGAGDERERSSVVEQLRRFTGDHPVATPTTARALPPPAATGAPHASAFRVCFWPGRQLLREGSNPIYLMEELRELGPCVVHARTASVPCLETLEAEDCYLWWEAFVSTTKGEQAIRGVFIFVEGDGHLSIEPLSGWAGFDDPARLERLGHLVAERDDWTAPELLAALEASPRAVAAPAPVSEAAPGAPGEPPARQAPAAPPVEVATVRVPAAKLDSLVDLVGELVIAQARLSQLALDRQDLELSNSAEIIERLASSLRDHTLEMRMVPIGTTFAHFKRLVRDLSSELGKEIELVTDGAETELDKTVIERLRDPLVHLIRNSCDHGIEGPEERTAAGKRAKGTVFLSARTSGANVRIEIRDDGRGLDPAAIRAKAEQRGLIAAGSKLSEKELFNLVFLPGFSTAKQVSNLSGRGVGLDVVKRAVDALRASLELTSVPGRGASITLTLPLTLAIIEGLLVTVGDGRYVLPMALVEECVELTREDVARAKGNLFASVRGEVVPYVPMRDWFRVDGDAPPIQQIAIARSEGMRFGVVVDQVIGQHQTVIKSLGRMYQSVEGLSGATILADGGVALIVDLPAIVRAASSARAKPVEPA